MADKPTYEELEQRVRELENLEAEHKQVEETLITERQRLFSLLNELPGFVYLQAPDHSIKFANKHFIVLFGEPDGKPCFKIIQNQKEPCDPCPTLRVFDTKEPQMWEWYRPSTNRTYQIYDYPFADVDGTPLVLELGIDITERKNVEAALKESEERYRAIFEQAADSIVIIDPSTGMFVDFNNKTYENLGYTRQEFEKFHLSEFEVVESKEEMVKHIEKVIKEGGDLFETKHRTTDGEIRNILVSSRVIYIHGREFIQSIWKDITDLKQTEKALHESENKFSKFFQFAPMAFAITKLKEGTYIDVNEAFLAHTGCSREEVIGHTPIELNFFTHSDRERLLKLLEKQGSFHNEEIVLRYKSGAVVNAFFSCQVISLAGEKYIITAAEDITKRKQAEEALQKAHDELERRVEERTKELNIKTKDLEELNAALKILLDKREQDKAELEEKILSNVKTIIEPYLTKVKKISYDQSQQTLINILESNLNEIISPFSRRLSSKYLNLSPSEIQVANLVKQGKTNKEIADILQVASRTIAFHRENIRKKLGLKNTKTNLKTYLMTLE